MKQQREIVEKQDIIGLNDINGLNDRKKSIESEQYEFGKEIAKLVPEKERKRTMSLRENNFMFMKKEID